ncbi:O-antigen ligase family protein [Priestia megaterium]
MKSNNLARNGMVINLVILISILCLFFTFTNVIPLSAGMALILPFMLILISANRTFHTVFLYLFLLLFYFFVSAIFYSYKQVLSYDFFRRDGNVFITFAPLLVLSFIRAKLPLNKIIVTFIYWCSIINLIFMLIYLATGGTIFFHEAVYNFLFKAHNAAGGFLGALCTLSIGYYFGTKQKVFLFFSIINLVGLYLTDSRGSILGLIIAFIIVILFKERNPKLVVTVIIIFQIVLLSVIYIQSDKQTFLSETFTYHSSGSDENRESTIAARSTYIWPRAIYLFLQSPVVGTGFGSYNDSPYNLYGIPHLLEINLPSIYINGDDHAHHTFLNVLAETGIIGLFLLFLFLFKVWKFINIIEKDPLRISLLLYFWFNILTSFTEHRLFTPSQMLPFTIILGLSIAHSRYENKIKKE